MRLLRTAAWTFLTLALMTVLLSGMATARPLLPVSKATADAPATHTNAAQTRHRVAMPFFSFKPRG
ncbi:MAG: hypothetical protein AVDCRST_MAG71-1062 [uncultured Lysobacter sp.]|uniref:Uncharacterized protein n=1 Tax=uncultured Lysobacter sp. TaxID=271060 RepID=A0A6J4KXF3_9GAMM|nr:MAG: hypothetical protein AVDCRST_MAG71-1062 [uncultured Lysobacter sp.]